MIQSLHLVKRKIIKAMILPLRVFVFHQVSDEFDSESMLKCDWTNTQEFKKRILFMICEGYHFISLPEAHKQIRADLVRKKRYAVLTADDGNKSIFSILLWLNDMSIPITLFINPQYIDGEHYRERKTEKYLTKDDLKYLCTHCPNITFGLHGWEHNDVTTLSADKFRNSIELSLSYLKDFSGFIPYYAYTWGKHNKMTDEILSDYGFTPVYCDGKKNYHDRRKISRECIDGKFNI